ncbi:hypothetical protein WJ45_10960 [Burkholderia ubonensis]|nr:hypothetical protein WJ45_10960 [Burkholderia ubonensis]KVN68781.1 hypothetical protein WJ67_27980 [Burkholderia ubonensis]KVO39609.1 hypothetical protein WJ75_08935 [Burkholderia ubonensis]KVQ52913.1 hypothetical protein WK04_04545 [Burkholderia ubonensis]
MAVVVLVVAGGVSRWSRARSPRSSTAPLRSRKRSTSGTGTACTWPNWRSRRPQLPPQERDVQIAALRQRLFTKPGDALRAASLDRGAAAAQ